MKSQSDYDLDYLITSIKSLIDKKTFFKVSEWAANKRYLPPELSKLSGYWNNDVTPYLVEIMDNLSENSFIRDIVFMKAAQIGATTGILENFLGYIIDHSPGPTLFVTADVKMAELSVELKIDRMIESAGLADKIYSQGKSKDGYNRKTGSTKTKKEFAGGYILAFGANSPAKLRMFAIKYLLLDELDAYPYSAGKEGDPVALAETRTDTFESTRKRLYQSTPLIKHTSKIYKLYKKGDQRKWMVPCKDCGHLQELKFFKNKDGKGGIVFLRDDDGNLIEDSVGYVCVECGSFWTNDDKIHFLKKGYWKPTETSSRPTLRSYHLNALYSPVGMLTWLEVVRKWLDAQRDIQKLKAFYNTVLGLPWEERGERPEYRKIMKNRISYLKGTVPKEALFLTLAADIHKDRIDLEILGWGLDQVTYSIDWISIEGDTLSNEGEAWIELRKIIMNGVGGHKISISLIDSGYLTDQVYRFCAQFGSGVYPLKGMPKYNFKQSIKLVDVDSYGDLKCVQVAVDFYKNRLAAWLKRERVDESSIPWGMCFYPADYKDEYFKQYDNEQIFEEVNKHGEITGYVWRKRNESAPNHAWDCRVYNLAAFDFFLDLIREHQEENFTIEQFYEFIKSNE